MATAWLELQVSVDNEAVEAVAELLARYGYNGGVVVEPAWTPGDEGPEFSYDPSRPSVLKTYLPLDEQAEDARQRIEHALWHLGQLRAVGPLQVRRLEEEDWANAWKQHYRVLRVGARIVVVPSWLEHQPETGDVVLHLDPGMAFGTGLHPTTQLCLELLEHHVRPGQQVLDLGTGSGILAIAAARLGAGHVLALDNDPVAVAVAAENIARNGVSATVTVAEGSLGAGSRMGHWLSGDFGSPAEPAPAVEQSGAPPGESVQQPSLAGFDLIVANLIAKVLTMLAADLTAALAPGGILISSGIIVTREAEVAEALAAAGLRQVARRVAGEWVALVHTRGA